MAINSQYISGISLKKDGQMKIYPDSDDALKNRKRFFDTLGLDMNSVVSAGLVHRDNVFVVRKEYLGQKIEKTDGLITNIPNAILTVTVADCLPVYFFDKNKGVIGIAHMGWRGVVQNLASKMIKKMKSEFDTDVNDVLVEIGPHIQSCHFVVKEDVSDQFVEYRDEIIREDNTVKLNLSSVVTKQLIKEGIKVQNIHLNQDCTYCLPEKYFSFRRDNPEKVEAMVAYILLKK